MPLDIGVRKKWQDKVCRIDANALTQWDWTVPMEPRIQLSPASMLKPDLIALKNERINIIDAQIAFTEKGYGCLNP